MLLSYFVFSLCALFVSVTSRSTLLQNFMARRWSYQREASVLCTLVNFYLSIKTSYIPDLGNSALQPDSSHIATVHS